MRDPGWDLSIESSGPRVGRAGRALATTGPGSIRLRVPPALRRALAAVVLMPLLALLAACAVVDPLSRDTCLSVLPAVEAGDSRITVLAVDADPAKAGNVRVLYRVEDGEAVRHKVLACAFGRDPRTGDDRALVGLRDADGEMSDARFYMLRRFWLGDPTTVAEGAARVHVDPTAMPHGIVTLSLGAGRVLQGIVDATAPAALYALLALACALIWGLVGRINFAFGDIAMLGAYGALIGALAVEAMGAAAAGPILGLALLCAVAIGASWGAALGRGVFVPLAFRSAQPLLIATVGLSIALQEFVARTQGARDRFLVPLLDHPRLVADGPFTVMVTPMRLVVVAVALSMTISVILVFPRTRLGRAWTAVADDALMARLLGIDPARVLTLTFALASALAATAGAIVTLGYGGTSFHMGTMLGLKAVVAAVVGGIGSLSGAALGGLLVGALEILWSGLFGIEWRDTAILSLLVVFLIFRPAGLFGHAEPAGPNRRDA